MFRERDLNNSQKVYRGDVLQEVGYKVMNISEGLTLSGCYVNGGDPWISNSRVGGEMYKYESHS